MGKRFKYNEINGKRIIYTDHALQRMAERQIDKKTVYSVLKEPQVTYPKKEDNTQKYRKKVDKRDFFVVVRHRKKSIVIVTVG